MSFSEAFNPKNESGGLEYAVLKFISSDDFRERSNQFGVDQVITLNQASINERLLSLRSEGVNTEKALRSIAYLIASAEHPNDPFKSYLVENDFVENLVEKWFSEGIFNDGDQTLVTNLLQIMLFNEGNLSQVNLLLVREL